MKKKVEKRKPKSEKGKKLKTGGKVLGCRFNYGQEEVERELRFCKKGIEYAHTRIDELESKISHEHKESLKWRRLDSLALFVWFGIVGYFLYMIYKTYEYIVGLL